MTVLPHNYSLFAYTFRSDFSLLAPTAAAGSPVDFHIRRLATAPAIAANLPPPTHTSRRQHASGEPMFYLFELADCDLIRLTKSCDFYIWPDRIDCLLHPGEDESSVDFRLRRTILAFFLERRGITSFHASAVVHSGAASGFLAHAGSGKTTLASGLLQQGAQLLSDDILTVEPHAGQWLARPSYPMLRLWPVTARLFLADETQVAQLPRVDKRLEKRRLTVGDEGAGQFCDEITPLNRLYLLDRKDDPETKARIAPLSGRDAVVELLRYAYLPKLTKAFGEQERLRLLTRLVQDIPVRRLTYPQGFEHLPEICRLIMDDTP